MIFQGIRPGIAKRHFIVVIFQGRGVQTPFCSSGSNHVIFFIFVALFFFSFVLVLLLLCLE